MLIALIIVLGLLLYAWVVFPALLLALMKVGRPAATPARMDPGKENQMVAQRPPLVALLFSAHNEEAVIRQRLENLASLDYPADRIRVFVGVDGGSDRTAEIAIEWAKSHPNVHVVASETNHGKTAMLKRLAGEIRHQTSDNRHQTSDNRLQTSDIRLQASGVDASLLVFTDANTMFAPDALRKLVAPFAEERVGGVCGRLIFLDDAGAETRENLYWRAETFLKTAESQLDSCLGANGAIYAIRKELFWSGIPDNTIIDDFVIGMKVREQGSRMVYEPDAKAYEQTPALIADEWRRRVRIGSGAFQAMSLCRACLLPRYGKFALCYASHKVLRWVTPHLLLLLTAVSALTLISGEGPAVVGAASVLAAGIGFLGLGAVGRLMGTSSRLKAIEYFLTMQAALFAGFLRYCRGNLRGSWERTERG